MSQADQVASSAGGVVSRHRGVKAPGGARKPETKRVRVQLHLGESVTRRLNVHAALVGRNSSRVAEEILNGWLSRFGKGREIFTDDPTVEASQATES
jgi:hypothetical protein